MCQLNSLSQVEQPFYCHVNSCAPSGHHWSCHFCMLQKFSSSSSSGASLFSDCCLVLLNTLYCSDHLCSLCTTCQRENTGYGNIYLSNKITAYQFSSNHKLQSSATLPFAIFTSQMLQKDITKKPGNEYDSVSNRTVSTLNHQTPRQHVIDQ
jgi:hypothetical protein